MNIYRILLLSGTFFLLTACDAMIDKMAEQVDETEMRTNFVDSCGSAMSESNHKITLEQSQSVCSCMYDTVKSQYSNAEEWKRNIIKNGLPSGDDQERTAFMQRFETAAPACFQQLLPNFKP